MTSLPTMTSPCLTARPPRRRRRRRPRRARSSRRRASVAPGSASCQPHPMAPGIEGDGELVRPPRRIYRRKQARARHVGSDTRYRPAYAAHPWLPVITSSASETVAGMNLRCNRRRHRQIVHGDSQRRHSPEQALNARPSATAVRQSEERCADDEEYGAPGQKPSANPSAVTDRGPTRTRARISTATQWRRSVNSRMIATVRTPLKAMRAHRDTTTAEITTSTIWTASPAKLCTAKREMTKRGGEHDLCGRVLRWKRVRRHVLPDVAYEPHRAAPRRPGARLHRPRPVSEGRRSGLSRRIGRGRPPASRDVQFRAPPCPARRPPRQPERSPP